MKTTAKVLALATVAAIGGCCKAPLPPTVTQPKAAVVASPASKAAAAEFTADDYTDLAEMATQKLLDSALVAGWEDKRPRLVLAPLRNVTGNQGIRAAEIGERIGRVLGDSGAVRLVDQSAASFDYVLRSELTPVRETKSTGEAPVGYRLELQLFAISGEVNGQWFATVTRVDGRKSCR